jgi:hypothetical protein
VRDINHIAFIVRLNPLIAQVYPRVSKNALYKAFFVPVIWAS